MKIHSPFRTALVATLGVGLGILLINGVQTLSTIILYIVLMLVPYVLLVFFALFYLSAGYVYFTALAAVPAIIIVLFAKTPRELVTALQLTLLSALVYGLGLGVVLTLPPA